MCKFWMYFFFLVWYSDQKFHSWRKPLHSSESWRSWSIFVLHRHRLVSRCFNLFEYYRWILCVGFIDEASTVIMAIMTYVSSTFIGSHFDSSYLINYWYYVYHWHLNFFFLKKCYTVGGSFIYIPTDVFFFLKEFIFRCEEIMVALWLLIRD